EDGAVDILKEKKNLRILVAEHEAPAEEIKHISGGVLRQEPDTYQAEGDKPENWQLVAGNALSDADLAELEDGAVDILKEKKNLRILVAEHEAPAEEIKHISG
ncbi:hypothetical protein HT105_23805, partial [Bacteroides fragilis]|nr:hypothetical protein [Bacteroides fragilis]